MSKENVKKFYEVLKADKALAEELRNAVNAVVLQFAAKQNLAFTAEELTEFETEVRKLSDEELDQVSAAGGVADDPMRAREAYFFQVCNGLLKVVIPRARGRH